MSLISMVSAKGSPGVSTSAVGMALAWTTGRPGRTVTLVDADVSGSAPSSTYQRHGLDDGRGLLAWAGAAASNDSLDRQLVRLGDVGTAFLLPGFPDGTRGVAMAGHWDSMLAALRADVVADRCHDILIDVGRLGSVHEAVPLIRGSDVVVLVLQPTYDQVSFACAAAKSLITQYGVHIPIAALLVGERRPYSWRDVAAAIDIPLLGVVAHDRKAAALISAGALDGSIRRSSLVRSGATVVAALPLENVDLEVTQVAGVHRD
jgi:hypothetical protein